MAAVSSIVAGVALAVGVGGAYMQRQESKRAQRAQQAAANEQKKANAVQSAEQAQQAAREQRQQIREERIRRAQIMQTAENTGTGGSSGALGAMSGLNTNFTDNIGANRSAIYTGQAITGFNQAAANYGLQASQAQMNGQTWGQIGGMGMQVFGAAGGFGTLFSATSSKTPKPTTGYTDRWAGASGSVY